MAASNEINSVIKACEIIACIVDGTHGISEISRKLGHNKTTVFKILNSFVTKGFVTKDPVTRKYYIGPFLQNMTVDLMSVHQMLEQCAIDEMKDLCARVEETVALQIPQGARRFVVCAVQHKSGLNFFAKTGLGGPLFVGPASKIMLSQYSDKDLNTLLDRMGYQPFLEFTPENKKALISDVNKAKKLGYSTSFGKHAQPGTGAIAVPIRNYSGPVALGVAGVEASIKRKKKFLIENLKVSAEIISRRLSDV